MNSLRMKFSKHSFVRIYYKMTGCSKTFGTNCQFQENGLVQDQKGKRIHLDNLGLVKHVFFESIHP